MKPKLLKTSFLLFGLMGLSLLGACEKLDPKETLVQWEGGGIRVGDFVRELKLEKKHYSEESLKKSKAFSPIKNRILNEMIERRLLLDEALGQGTYVGEAELQREINLFKSQYTEMSFQKMLQEVGITHDQWVARKKENLIVKKYLDRATSLSHPLSPERIRAYYDENLEWFKQPEAVRVRQIVTDTKEKAEAILRRLRKGENFAKLARDLSLSPDRKRGGDLGFIVKGSFPREFEVCFNMNPGEVSPIIPSAYGFHLFKVLEKTPEKTASFEEVEGQIVLRLKREARETGRKQLVEDLRKQKQVLIHEEILERVTL